MTRGLKAYSGVVHVHSDKSGGATLDAIVKAAKECGVQFVVLTDVGVKRSEVAKWEGWKDDVLVMVGEEVYAPDGHLLAFETREEINESSRIEYAIEEVRRQVGVVAGTHYHLEQKGRTPLIPPPLPLKSVDMVEIWSFYDEFLANVRSNSVMQFHARPDRMLFGPPRKTVQEWDEEQLARSVAAVGGLNAHTRKEPLLEWREFFPLNKSFKTIRTVINCPELPKSDKRARDLVWTALRQGHSYLCNVSLGNPEGFEFLYKTPKGEVFHMGDTTEYVPGGRIHVKLPEEGEAEIVIRLNSSPLMWGSGTQVNFPAPAPGVYRIEAIRDRRVWIFSNAIRVLASGAPSGRPPTFIDFT